MLYVLGLFRRLALACVGSAATGFVLGLLSWAWCSQFVMAWGTGIEVAGAIACALLVAAATMLRPGRTLTTEAPAWVWLALAAWTALTPTLLTDTTVPRASILDDPLRAFLAVLTSALVILVPAVCLLLRALPARALAGNRGWTTWASGGAAWCVAPLTLGAWPGPHATALCAAALLLARFARELTSYTPTANSNREGEASAEPHPGETSPLRWSGPGNSCQSEILSKGPASRWRRLSGSFALPSSAAHASATYSDHSVGIGVHPTWLSIAAPSLAAGIATVMVQWIQTQLFLSTAALMCATWGGLLLGIAVGMRNPVSDRAAANRRSARHVVTLGCCIALLAVTFPWLLQLAMGLSASVSWLPAIVGLRSLIMAALMLPAGLALGATIVAGRRSDGARLSIAPLLGVSCFLLGVCGARLADLTLLAALPFTIATGTAGLILWFLAGRRPDASAIRRWAGVSASVCGVMLALVANPAAHLAGQRMLFSGAHFQARAHGVPANLLSAIDDGRLMRSTISTAGVTSVWSHSGMQWVLRENGLTRGVISTQPDLCPQPITEVLSAVLPLTVHTQPHNILITSASYPAVVATCLSFPIESVTAIDDNPQALAFCRAAAERAWPNLTAGDNRLSLQQADAVRGVATCDRLFDVVIAPDSVMGNLESSRKLTVEHFRDIAAHLAPTGVFCQRVTCFDLNVDSVLDVVHTAQKVFPTVQLSEAAPGEWLLVARPTAEIGLDKTFLERLERRHVREVLAQAGWDWSIMLSLKTVHSADLLKLAEHADTLSAGEAQVAFSLPLDVMSWGPKFEQRRRWMSQQARPLGDALGAEPGLAEVGQRLSDVTLAQQVVIDHPDQFWAYRRHVKKRLQDRPRPKVIQVAGEGLKNGLDPEDARRKQYLKALGQAAESKARTDIDQLTAFLAPFDPLVSPFVPRELIFIDRQSAAPDFVTQWRYGLRSIYFAPPSDRSVNNVCDALELVHAQPALAGDAAAQWECRNALLEVLKNRWGLRMTLAATLRYDVSDADRSVTVATTTLADMDGLREAADISADAWAARRTVLEKHLVRPVRSWRTEQSARFALQSAASEDRTPEDRESASQ